jgi:hypothetical protein
VHGRTAQLPHPSDCDGALQSRIELDAQICTVHKAQARRQRMNAKLKIGRPSARLLPPGVLEKLLRMGIARRRWICASHIRRRLPTDSHAEKEMLEDRRQRPWIDSVQAALDPPAESLDSLVSRLPCGGR